MIIMTAITSTANYLDGGDGEFGECTELLQRIAARCRFALTSDRLVERLHAYNRHFLVSAPNAGCVHIAFFSVAKTVRDFD